MSEQMSLFDVIETQYGVEVVPSQSLCRPSDPETSDLGAQQVALKLTAVRQAFLDVLGALKRATANEVGRSAVDAGVVANRETVRKRAKELEAAGLVRVVGSRKCAVTGAWASVYEVVR